MGSVAFRRTLEPTSLLRSTTLTTVTTAPSPNQHNTGHLWGLAKASGAADLAVFDPFEGPGADQSVGRVVVAKRSAFGL
jgi:hypothetical protein